jgi:hypothetical protein
VVQMGKVLEQNETGDEEAFIQERKKMRDEPRGSRSRPASGCRSWCSASGGLTQVVVDPAQSSLVGVEEKKYGGRAGSEINRGGNGITDGGAGSERTAEVHRRVVHGCRTARGGHREGASTDHEMFRAFDLAAGFFIVWAYPSAVDSSFTRLIMASPRCL